VREFSKLLTYHANAEIELHYHRILKGNSYFAKRSLFCQRTMTDYMFDFLLDSPGEQHHSQQRHSQQPHGGQHHSQQPHSQQPHSQQPYTQPDGSVIVAAILRSLYKAPGCDSGCDAALCEAAV
jgi:hypothetical protein